MALLPSHDDYAVENLVVEKVPFDPRRPFSPLAVKYGVPETPFWRRTHPDGRAHSSMASEFPAVLSRTLPTSRGQGREPDPEIEKPGNEDLDRLFRAERAQVRYKTFGLKTWQHHVFSQSLYDGWPAGEDFAVEAWEQWQSYKTKLITVDETKWISCFRKDHWFDMRTPIMNSLRGPIPDIDKGYPPHPNRTWWTVDNPVLWEPISVVIELSCRILRRMCQERNEWLDALLFATPVPCGSDPGRLYHEDSRHRAIKIMPRSPFQRASPQALLEALESLSYRRIIFSFLDESTYTDPPIGVTERRHYITPSTRCIVKLNVGFCLRTLFERETTVPERCTTLLLCTTVLLHEFGHALWMAKFPLGTDLLDEPYFFNEWISELGYSMTTAIFGGTIDLYPLRMFVDGRYRGYGAILSQDAFPSLKYARQPQYYEHNARKFHISGAVREFLYIIPSYWTSAMLCEKYWTEVVSKYGSVAFKPPHIIVSELDTSIVYSAHRAPIPEYRIPELEAEYRKVVERWDLARADMDTIRGGWYKAEFEAWSILPWSNVMFRNALEEFAFLHAARDEFGCRDIVLSVISRYMPTRERVLNDSPGIIYFLIGLLMLASTPIGSPVALTKLLPARYATLWPSLNARAWFHSEEVGEAIGPYDPRIGYPEERLEPSRAFPNINKVLHYFRGYFGRLEFCEGGPLAWLTGMLDCYNTIVAERSANIGTGTWTNFTFTIPPYEQGWVVASEKAQPVTTPIQLRYQPVVPWTDGDINPFEPSPPPSPIVRPGGVATRGNRGDPVGVKRVYPLHLYIGEVANHRSLNDAWVVEPDNSGGFDTFNITDILRTEGATEDDYRAIVAIGPQGPALVHGSERADFIRKAFHVTIQPIGKLLLLRRLEELAERNGQNGQPAWTNSGGVIYDITNFPFESPEEQAELARSAGGPLSRNLMRAEERAAGLLRRLGPYACAYLDAPKSANRNLKHFTLRTLRWHDNPDSGVYIALGNIVFDISTYIRFHPGGSRLFLQCTGRDATQLFAQHHHLDLMNSYEALQVGYLVPDIEISSMGPNHVLVHDWVFDISALENENPSLYNDLRRYAAQDTAPILNAQDVQRNNNKAALVTLYLERKDLIVAGLAKTSLPDIPDREVVKHNDHQRPDGALVVVGGYVYNVTHLMRYPEYYEFQLGHSWAGSELKNPALAEWLTTNFGARCVGRVVPGEAWPEPDTDIDLSKPFMDIPEDIYPPVDVIY